MSEGRSDQTGMVANKLFDGMWDLDLPSHWEHWNTKHECTCNASGRRKGGTLCLWLEPRVGTPAFSPIIGQGNRWNLVSSFFLLYKLVEWHGSICCCCVQTDKVNHRSWGMQILSWLICLNSRTSFRCCSNCMLSNLVLTLLFFVPNQAHCYRSLWKGILFWKWDSEQSNWTEFAW